MKKGIATMILFCALAFCAQPVSATTVDPSTNTTTDTTVTDPATTPDTVYSVTVAFNKNGGKGSMTNLTVASNATTATVLPKNTFTRKNFTFGGWNTAANGSGTAYANLADVSTLATAENNGQTVTLYAQWKINAPQIKKIKKMSPTTIKVTFKKNSKAAGYEIQYSVKKNFSGAKKVSVKKKLSSKEVSGLTPGKANYVRIRSYYKSGGKKLYGDWSKSKKVKMKKGYTIENTKALTAIEADITLTGSGSGYHAKIVLTTPTSAVSFGIQHDEHAVAPYTHKSMALIENVEHNGPGGQTYTRPGNRELQCGKTYKMMITVDRKGNGNVYLDYEKIGSFHNSGLANAAVGCRVEGAVRLNGDSIKATFDNIKLKQAGKYEKDKLYGGNIFASNPTIKTKKVEAKNKVIISGKGTGINGDWDSDYEGVSGIFQFY
ncbi:MAG: InlB B-repeat-containing protein [Lachnospiraceae bacterium]|nr:InlB B-repeat-containing protein [Lachnospiraceae bacterium]